jgi:hypothetical protein
VSDELLPAVKAIEELEPAVQAFAEATGAFGPVREFTAWATDLIRYRRAPHQAKLLMRAAEKIKASGLPPSAVSDRLLRAALEDGAMEDDEAMQERWANLLANAGTGSPIARAAFGRVLSELEPEDAAILDRTFERMQTEPVGPLQFRDGAADFVALDNLARLGLADYNEAYPLSMVEVSITAWGQTFVRACRAPHADSSPSS